MTALATVMLLITFVVFEQFPAVGFLTACAAAWFAAQVEVDWNGILPVVGVWVMLLAILGTVLFG